MTSLVDRAAQASLVVAIGLIAGAALAWIVVRSQRPDAPWTLAAGAHLTALADWGLGFLAAHALALMLGANSAFTAWAATAALAAVAVVLRDAPRVSADGRREPAGDRPEVAPTPGLPATTTVRATRRTLWTDPGNGRSEPDA
jgi:hypothetical protein